MDPQEMSLTRQTVRGAKWSYASTAATVALQVVLTAILARILGPPSFGLLAMANVVLRFGQYFSQMGIGQAIVQRKRLTAEEVGAAFWLSAGIGAVVAFTVAVCAPLFARFFVTAEVTPVIRVLSITLLLSALASVPQAMLRRAFRFRGLAAVDLASYAVGFGLVGIGTALAGAGVWSLVFASIVQSVLQWLGSWGVARSTIKPSLHAAPYRALLGFGSRVSLIGFIEFLNSNLDTAVVGRLGGADTLGLYSRGQNVVGMPLYYLSSSMSRVLAPAFSRVQEDSERLRAAYLKVMTVASVLVLPFAVVAAIGARELVMVLLGAKWLAAVPVVRIAAFASAFDAIAHFPAVLLEATGNLNRKLVARVVNLGVFAALLIALARYGVTGFATAFALGNATGLGLTVIVLRMDCGIPLSVTGGAVLEGILASAVAAGGALAVTLGLGRVGASPFLVVAILAAVSMSCYAATLPLLASGRVWRMISEILWPQPESLSRVSRWLVARGDRIAQIRAGGRAA